MIQDTLLTGITCNTANGVAADGECAELINLMLENGSLRPAITPQLVYSFDESSAGRKIVFIHRNQNYENWISYDGLKLYFEASESNGTVTTIAGTPEICATSGDVKIEAIGNTLIVLDFYKRYILFKEGGYKMLGEKPPFPYITFGIADENPSVRESGSIELEGGEIECYEGPNNTPPKYFLIDNHNNNAKYMDRLKAALNSSLAEIKEMGLFVFPFFIRYAVRLYDDTLIYHSAPILMNNRFKEAITSLTSGCEVVGPNSDGNYYMLQFGFKTTTYPKKLNYSTFTETLKGWEDVVKSVDIFASEELPHYKQAGTSSKVYRDGPLEYPCYTDEEMVKRCAETSNFYKLHSLKMDNNGIITDPTGDICPQDNLLNTLVQQERMTDGQCPQYCVNDISGSGFSRALNPDSVFKDNQKLVHHQSPVPNRHRPFFLNLL